MSVNFNNLWNNYQNTRNRQDVTGDGKYNSKDSSQLSKEKTSLLKETDVFDITGDGKVTQDDLDMMVNGFDIDGDGQISNLEKNFEKTYLSTMVSQMKKTDETFVYNNVAWSNGKTYTGELNGLMYKNGRVLTGTYNGKYYYKGEVANGKCGSYMYKDGVKVTGVNEDDGLYYQNGLVKTGNVKDDKTTTTYKKGEFQYSVTDNNEKDYPNQSGQNIRFKNGTKYTNVKLEIGSSAIINEDGTVEITDKDNNKIKYDSTGNIIEDVEQTQEAEQPVQSDEDVIFNFANSSFEYDFSSNLPDWIDFISDTNIENINSGFEYVDFSSNLPDWIDFNSYINPGFEYDFSSTKKEYYSINYTLINNLLQDTEKSFSMSSELLDIFKSFESFFKEFSNL